jgi:hypothetical protein
LRCWAAVVGVGTGASAGVGKSSDVRTDELGVSEGDCVTLGDCMRVELVGEWERGEDIVAIANRPLGREGKFCVAGNSVGKISCSHF